MWFARIHPLVFIKICFNKDITKKLLNTPSVPYYREKKSHLLRKLKHTSSVSKYMSILEKLL